MWFDVWRHGQKSDHGYSHGVPESGGRLAIVILLNFTVTVAEVIGGLISGSLSLLSDALHNFSDGRRHIPMDRLVPVEAVQQRLLRVKNSPCCVRLSPPADPAAAIQAGHPPAFWL